ncbi:unnamed protein product [Cuscuta europaea]|uniref:DUF1985 domain-containing protein n=1 Tax=Cuscuta europaea TaxID=41803 RepID=A0A9P0Z8H6_CUSEU|nr:unnamed protein product [Cuscuta europaea]
MKKLRVNCYCNLLEVVKTIKMYLSAEEITKFRGAVFGWILDVESISWVSGQLLLGLIGNHVEEVNHIIETEKITFNIRNSLISFTKEDFALVTSFRMDGAKKNKRWCAGDLWKRYFNGKSYVSRQNITDAFTRYNCNNEGTVEHDGVKLGLLYMLGHGLFGNQNKVALPSYYVNLVDDLEVFYSYPWGRDIWDDLVNYAGKSVELLSTSKSDRVTFPGFMFAMQIWAFEMLSGLSKAGICMLKKDQDTVILHTLKWVFTKKPNMDLLCKLIFYNNEFEYKPMEVTTQDMEIPQLAMLFQNFKRERWQFDGGMDCSEEIEMEDDDKDAECNDKQAEKGSAKVDKKKSMSQKGVVVKNVSYGSKKLKKQCTNEKKDDDEDDSLLTSLVKKTDIMMADMARIKIIQRNHGSLLRRILKRLEGKQVMTDQGKEVSEGGNIEIKDNGTEKDAKKGNDKETEQEVDDVEELVKNDEKEAMAKEDGEKEKENTEVSQNEIDSQRPSFNIFGFSSQEEQNIKNTDDEGLEDLNDARDSTIKERVVHDTNEKVHVDNGTGEQNWEKLNDDDTDFDADELLKVDELVIKTIQKSKEKSTETTIEESHNGNGRG